ncbi:hypothetical protein [Naasia aerilata]|uniref:Uncharacterized protein n=1 Tax=Naasia aerilata TaxID=1162966 RepID=A0ABN6XTM4_9MICO|nr:hypothetical protein [Naasia aerilata]BDZ47493.1 hypothetical protein GCM10025866_34020 [Naasia aerilata]
MSTNPEGSPRAGGIAAAVVGVLVVAVSAATLFFATSLAPSGDAQPAGEGVAPGEPTPGDTSGGAAGGNGIDLAPPEKVNGCGGPLAELAPVESGLVATPHFPGAAPADGGEVAGTVTLTNTGTARAVGWTGARPAVTVSENGTTVWHSNGPVIQLALEIDLDPGESMELPATLRTVRCDSVDEESEAFREGLPPLTAGTYGISAIVPFTPDGGGAVQYAGGPLTSITLQ